MASAIRSPLRGAVAGAAGTTALSAAGYADIALRGRPVRAALEITVRSLRESCVSVFPVTVRPWRTESRDLVR